MTTDQEKTVKKIFSSIAKKYDWANSVFTLGLDQRWRKKLVDLSSISKDAQVLDCATGTGALAKSFLEQLGPHGKILAVDFCEEMLKQVPFQDPRCSFRKENVLSLSFEDQTFDITSIAYGLRNLSDMEKGIKEMARVTKSGGYLMILETGRPQNPILRPFVDFYCWFIMPILGWMITGNFQAYKYLNNSSAVFPSGEEMVQKLKSTGCFKSISFHSLIGGVSFIYKAQVHDSHTN